MINPVRKRGAAHKIESLTIVISGFNDRGLLPEAPGEKEGN
jgi:hypothetical protein